MVGLVLVSHSEPLARALLELIRQAASPDLPLAAAAGTADPARPFGTDAERIREAVDSLAGDDGVLVLMDLGSALLSADLALELLGPAASARVRLCAAPLVEGALAAAARSAAGGSLAEVAAEAEAALLGKQEQLRGTAGAAPPAPPAANAAWVPGAEGRAVLPNRLGLHLRPAAAFVRETSRHRARVRVSDRTRGTGPADGRSLNRLVTLGARQGDELLIEAEGEDAAAAVTALVSLVRAGSGEEEAGDRGGGGLTGPPAPEPALQGARELAGLPASPGIAVGRALRIGGLLGPEAAPAGAPAPGADSEAERRRLREALDVVRGRLRALVAGRIHGPQSAILEAHLLSLDDPALLEEADRLLATGGGGAEAAWEGAVDRLAAGYRSLPDPYLRERSADLEDLGRQVLSALASASGEASASAPPGPGILLCDELSSSDLARFPPGRLLGAAAARGSPSSHAAIMARSLGIPAVVGLGHALLAIPAGTPVALDGVTGRFWVEPPHAAELRRSRGSWLKGRRAARGRALRPAVTRDGHRVRVEANVRDARETEAAIAWGAEGVGLLRTEYLLLGRTEPPGEEEQLDLYRSVAAAVAGGGRAGGRVTVRTFDIGGDKEVSFLRRPAEANPFLGVRGSRLYAAFPALIRTQLRALLRAGTAAAPLQVMFPMVTHAEELEGLLALLRAVREELLREGVPCGPPPAAGVMIEVPSAALQASRLAGLAGFFSIGTNDLAQYLFAADRGQPELAGLSDPLHPALLGLVQATALAARKAGIPVALCGELAGAAAAAPLLVGLGVEELSMFPPAIPAVKEAIRATSLEAARGLARRALALGSAAEVRELLAAGR